MIRGALLLLALASAGEVFSARMEEAFRHDRQNRPGRAVRAYSEALRALPPPPLAADAYRGRGTAHFRLGLLDRARADLDLAAELSARPAEARWLRAYAGLAAGAFDTAAEDGRFAVRRLGAGHPAGAYAAILSYLASRGASPAERARGTELLAAAARGADPSAWPAPVLYYMTGEIDEESLLAFAQSDGERTEARTYLGIARALAGDTASARAHLAWVAERGDPSYLEFALARAWRERMR